MSQDSIRFATFLREVCVRQRTISFNLIAPKVEVDAAGKMIPHSPQQVKLRTIDIYNLLKPYISTRFMEQCRSVVPLVIYLLLFQILALHQELDGMTIILTGVLAVIFGLMLFMEGLKLGLMPFGETIGNRLPVRSPLPVVLLIVMLLGVGVTFAEPAIGALKTAGSIVNFNSAPYLYTLLNNWSTELVLIVGVGVGLAAVLGVLRLLYGWSLKPLIYATLLPILTLTFYFMQDEQLSRVLGLAWDCGAVTTGPVTVPLVLSLGIGIAAAAGKGNSPLSGFGIVTLASLFPIIGVMLLTLIVVSGTSPEEIIATAAQATSVTAALPWYDRSPGMEIIGGIRAIVPLIIFLLIVLKLVLKESIPQQAITIYGITLCVLGLIIFNLGLTFGLAKIGAMAGSQLPAAFSAMESVAKSPFYTYGQGMIVAVLFAWLLGFGATLAEPALNALGHTVENLTNGSFSKRMLMYAVSFGVACGIATGVLKIAFDLPLGWLLIPTYSLATILTWLSSEEYVNVAWDSAGVTTGPVTVPLVLAMGLGLGNAVDAVEGFGILSMASIGPIICVLSVGLYVQRQTRLHHQQDDESKILARRHGAAA
ncbi:MAG: DUF1538 domain-containing protein [Mariprofundales bacterium]|nr:DUF1538 domain-containing protein [Mariprofundales bacterium]